MTTPWHRARIAVLVIAALAACVSAIVSVHVRGRDENRSRSASATSSAATAYRLTLPKGTEYVYDLEAKSETTLRVPELGAGKEGTIRGQLDLAAELVLVSHGERGGAFVLSAALQNVRRHGLRLLDREAMVDAQAARDLLDGRTATVEIEPTGRVRSILFSPGDPPLYKHLVQTLLSQLELTLSPIAQRQWTGLERGPSGEARAHYTVEAGREEPRAVLRRKRLVYDRVDALPGVDEAERSQELRNAGEIALDPAGHIHALTDSELLVVRRRGLAESELTSRCALSLVSKSVSHREHVASAGEALAGKDVVAAFAESAEEREHRLLAQVAGELTLSGVLDGVACRSLEEDVDTAWLSAATAYLALDPDRCNALVKFAVRGGLDARQLGLVADLLAGAGTPAAQAALRTLLDSPAAKADAGTRALLLQRFALVAEPDAASSAFLYAAYRGQDRETRLASAHALGSTAGRLVRAGDRQAIEYVDRLHGDLRTAKDEGERAALVAAVGNTGLPEAAAAIEAMADDGAPSVRAQVARSLGGESASPSAKAALLDLATDGEAGVAKAAVSSLGRSPLASADVEKLCGAVAAGETPAASDSDVLLLLARNLHAPGVDAALRAIVVRSADDPRLAHRARQLQKALCGPSCP